jgi:hypothetical protein
MRFKIFFIKRGDNHQNNKIFSYDAQENKISKTKTVESEYIQSDANYINSFIGNLRTVKFLQLTINHNIISISFN